MQARVQLHKTVLVVGTSVRSFFDCLLSLAAKTASLQYINLGSISGSGALQESPTCIPNSTTAVQKRGFCFCFVFVLMVYAFCRPPECYGPWHGMRGRCSELSSVSDPHSMHIWDSRCTDVQYEAGVMLMPLEAFLSPLSQKVVRGSRLSPPTQ